VKNEQSFDNSAYVDEMHGEDSELSAFVNAVKETLGPDRARLAAEDWLDESELRDTPPRSIGRDWRAVTIAASARMANSLVVVVVRHHPAPSIGSCDTNAPPIP
jgi:hypothetical protein